MGVGGGDDSTHMTSFRHACRPPPPPPPPPVGMYVLIAALG